MLKIISIEPDDFVEPYRPNAMDIFDSSSFDVDPDNDTVLTWHDIWADKDED